MSHLNRRNFISSVAIGGIAGLSGCTGGGDGQRPDDSHEPTRGNTTEGEITEINGRAASNPHGSGWAAVEVEFEADGELQEAVDLVVQIIPHKYSSPEYTSEESADVRTVDKIRISETSGGYPADMKLNLMDYWDDIPGVNEHAFKVQLGLELESRQGVNIKEVVDRGFIAYTHRETGEETRRIDSQPNRHVWEENGEQHIVLVGRTPHESKYYGDVPSIMFVVKHSLSMEDMDSLDAIYEDDPLAWQDYLETRSEGSLSNIQYLERPIFADIADTIQSAFERHNLTEDDDLIVRTAYGLIADAIRYDQPWDTVSESVRVPYPEIAFREGGGDCKAQGFAVNGVLHHLGYDTSLFLFRMDDAPPMAYHHLSGGVGMDLDPENSLIGERIEGDEGRDAHWRHPEFVETDERSADHISIDPSTLSVAAYSPVQTATTWHFVEGK